MKRNWQRAFLASLEENGSVTEAAKVCGIGRSNLYQHKRKDKDFEAQWEQALDVAADTLEDEARRRAFNGSDTLLIFLLKGVRPQKYRESRATIPPAELNKMIEAEFARLADKKQAEEAAEVM